MKASHLILPVLILLVSLSCQTTDKPSDTKTGSQVHPPIDGSWELVENKEYEKVIKPKRPQQFKMFHDGFFSFMMYNPDGSFHGSGAGTYSIEGDLYKETFRYYSDTIWVGSSDWQKWKLDGDTLYFYGFQKGIDRNGNDVTQAWGSNKFVQKHIRARQ